MGIQQFREKGMVAAVCEELDLDIKQYPILIETGTYKGDTSYICSKIFQKIYTIELSRDLYNFCVNKYKSSTNIEFICGDSAQEIKQIVSKLKQKYILFLDAHGSGGDTTFSEKYGRYGTPILKELEATIENPPDVIIIDDYKDYQYINVEDCVKKLGEYKMFSFPEIANWELVFVKIK